MEEVVLSSEVEKRYAPSSLAPNEVQVEVDPTLQAEMRKFLREYYAELTVTKSMTIPASVLPSVVIGAMSP